MYNKAELLELLREYGEEIDEEVDFLKSKQNAVGLLIEALDCDLDSRHIFDTGLAAVKAEEPSGKIEIKFLQPSGQAPPEPDPEPEPHGDGEPQAVRSSESGVGLRLNMAAAVLRECGPLHKKRLWEVLEAQGVTSRAKDPIDALMQSLVKDSRFEPSPGGLGYWRLAGTDTTGIEPEPPLSKPDAEPEPESGMEVLEAALAQILGSAELGTIHKVSARILFQDGPLHAKPLIKALEAAGVEVGGETSTAKYRALQSELSRAPLVFRKTGPNLWALRR